MSEQHFSVPSQEVAPAAKVYLIYRDNTLFQTVIPAMVEELRSMGRFCEVVSFPVGTEPHIISEHLSGLTEQLSGCTVLADATCKTGFGYKSDRGFELENLDTFVSDSVAQQIYGGAKPEREKVDYTAGRDYDRELGYMKNALELVAGANAEKFPLYIVVNKIADHDFKNYLLAAPNLLSGALRGQRQSDVSSAVRELNSMDRAELNELIERCPLFQSACSFGFDDNELKDLIVSLLAEASALPDPSQCRFVQGNKSWDGFIADKIANLARLYGFDVVVVDRVDDIPQASTSRYVIVDRHECVGDGINPYNFRKLNQFPLTLPFSNLVADLSAQGIVSVDVVGRIKEHTREYFS